MMVGPWTQVFEGTWTVAVKALKPASTTSNAGFFGSRVVIREPGRKAVLMELHEGHPGIAHMKSLAQMYVWWPGISEDIEEAVRGCKECQLNQSSPQPAPLHPWSWPSRPWARLHLDYAGPVQGKMYLILINAHSKWIKAFCTPNAISSTVIEELRTLFAHFGHRKLSLLITEHALSVPSLSS